MLPDYLKFRESESIPDHIVILLGPINSIMINTRTNQITEIDTDKIKQAIREELQHEQTTQT